MDNITKAVLDGCSDLWSDDRQVAILEVVKLNVPRGSQGVTVQVETIDDEEVRSQIIHGWTETTGE